MGRKRNANITSTKSKSKSGGINRIKSSVPVPSTSSSSSSSLSNFKNEEEFQAEMDRVISDVMEESLYLLQKDPREYHPFYLRTFKYISIGQKLGYISSFKEANAIWEKYDKLCENQVSLIGFGAANESFFAGEESPYATFIKTGRVVVSGKEISVNRNEAEVKKRIKKLEGTAKEIFEKWKNSKRKGKPENIRNDLKTRLEFFGHCQTMTFPSDCVEMNNIWSKFLNHFAPEENAAVAEAIVKVEVDEEQEEASASHLAISILETQPVQIKRIFLPLEKKKIGIPRRRNNLENISPPQTQAQTNHKKFESLSTSMKKRFLKRKWMDRSKARNKLETMISLSASLPKSKLKSMRIDKPESGGDCNNFESFTAPSSSPSPPNSPNNSSTAAAADALDVEDEPIPEQIHGANSNSNAANVSVSAASIMCELCGEIFLSKASVILHKSEIHNIHPPGNKCPAPLCLEEFPTGLLLWEHFEATHSAKIGESSSSSALERRKEIRKKPRSTATATSNLLPLPKMNSTVCPICGKSFWDSTNLRRHIRQQHASSFKSNADAAVDSEDRSFICPHCGKTYKSKDWLTVHIKQDHLGISYRCDVDPCCNKNLQSAGKLWKHKVDVHGLRDLEPPPGVNVLQCYICGEQMLRGLERHIEKSHPEQLNENETEADAEAKRIRMLDDKRTRTWKNRARKYFETGIGPASLIKDLERSQREPCPHCGILIAKKNGQMGRHLTEEHGLGERCPVEGCSKMYVNAEENMPRHIREQHPNIFLANYLIEKIKVVKVKPKRKKDSSKEFDCWNWKCDICSSSNPPTTFLKKEEIAIHFLLKHQQTLEVTEGVEKKNNKWRIDPLQYPLDCLHCEEKFCGERNLRNHVETLHSSKCWKCPEMGCERIITSKDDLQEHSYLEHGRGRRLTEWKRFYDKEISDRIARGLHPCTTKTIRRQFRRLQQERASLKKTRNQVKMKMDEQPESDSESNSVVASASSTADFDFEEETKTKRGMKKIKLISISRRKASSRAGRKRTSVKNVKVEVEEEPETDSDGNCVAADNGDASESDYDFYPGGNLSQQQQKYDDDDEEYYEDTIAGRRKRMKRNSSSKRLKK